MIIETTALIQVGAWIVKKISSKGIDHLLDKSISEDEINKKFYSAVENTANALEVKYPKVLGSSIIYFFKKDEVFNELIKIMFVDASVSQEKIKSYFDTSTLPEVFISEFLVLLKKNLLKDPQLNKIFTNKKIFISLQNIEEDVSQISGNSNLTLDEIKKIRAILEEHSKRNFNFQRFINEYSKNAINNLSQINYIGLGVDTSIKRNRKLLQDIYVKPSFSLDKSKIKKDKRSIDEVEESGNNFEDVNYKDLFSYSNSIVVLGKPGSGKSILVKSIICDILQDDGEEFEKEIINQTIPFRIELRKYLSFKKQKRGNIQKYLTSLLEEEYSITFINEKILDDIIKNQNCLIFFDGLDEIFKLRDKVSIKNDIVNFQTVYSKTITVTTSRIIGYEEAKLKNDFLEFKIKEFNNDQIQEYINKWYKIEEKISDIREQEVKGLLKKKNEIDDELLSNPLLLSLIVILYRNTLKVPDSKLEIYQSCTKTLVNKWDASKELVIDIEEEILKNKEKILADLAYWQYQQFSGDEVDITYEKACQTVRRTIENKLKIGDEFTSEDKADSFMEYAEKRSIYFDNNFTHKTFLEFYTAYWIYSNVEKKGKFDERNKLISKYVDNSFWHIVLELLLNMIDKDQADSEIIDRLIRAQLESIKSLPFIFASIPTLNNISREVIQESIEKAVDVLIKKAFTKRGKESRNVLNNNLEIQIFKSLRFLYNDDEKYYKLINKILNKKEEEYSESELEVYILFLELHLYFPKKAFAEYKKVIFDVEKFNKVITQDKYAYTLNYHILKYNKDNITNFLLEFIDRFGKEYLFTELKGLYFRFSIGSLIGTFIRHHNFNDNIKQLESNLNKLISKGVDKVMIFEAIVGPRKHILHSYLEIVEKYVEKLKCDENEITKAFSLLQVYRFYKTNKRRYEIRTESKENGEEKFLEKFLEKYDLSNTNYANLFKDMTKKKSFKEIAKYIDHLFDQGYFKK